MEQKIVSAGAFKTVDDMVKLICQKNVEIEAIKIELATNSEKMTAMFEEIKSLRPTEGLEKATAE